MKDISIVEWLALAVTIVIAGWSGAAAWNRTYRKELLEDFTAHQNSITEETVIHKLSVDKSLSNQERLVEEFREELERKMEATMKRVDHTEATTQNLERVVQTNSTTLAVVANCQQNTERRLTEIAVSGSELNGKFDDLMKVLLTKGPHS